MIQSIRLQNFRSYKDATFSFEGSVNIIVGPNGSGKTNLLEAILFVCQGASYRGADNIALMYDTDWFRVDGSFSDHARTLKLETKDGLRKSLTIDDKTISKIAHSHKIPVVLFEPNQLQLLTTQPEMRRQLIDTMLGTIDYDFYKTKKTYTRILMQRNNLLKQNRANLAEDIFPWDVRISEFGAIIAQRRLELLSSINSDISGFYNQISGNKNQIKLTYKTNQNPEHYANSMLTNLKKSFPRDIVLGYTSEGPHRDDIELWLDNKQFGATASRGEIRSLLLALKTKEALLYEKSYDQKPLILLDDINSELDQERAKNASSLFVGNQIFITAPHHKTPSKKPVKTSKLIQL